MASFFFECTPGCPPNPYVRHGSEDGTGVPYVAVAALPFPPTQVRMSSLCNKTSPQGGFSFFLALQRRGHGNRPSAVSPFPLPGLGYFFFPPAICLLAWCPDPPATRSVFSSRPALRAIVFFSFSDRHLVVYTPFFERDGVAFAFTAAGTERASDSGRPLAFFSTKSRGSPTLPSEVPLSFGGEFALTPLLPSSLGDFCIAAPSHLKKLTDRLASAFCVAYFPGLQSDTSPSFLLSFFSQHSFSPPLSPAGFSEKYGVVSRPPFFLSHPPILLRSAPLPPVLPPSYPLPLHVLPYTEGQLVSFFFPSFPLW